MEKENNLAGILTKLNELEKLLKHNHDTPLNFVQAARYLSISHSHLYKMTSQRKIPFHKPSGKYLYFFKHELDAWIRRNDDCGLTNEEQQSEGGNQESVSCPENQLGLFGEADEMEPP